jgi:hypothetical protein
VHGNPLFGKFGPIILLGVVQLVLILAVPSTAPNAATSALGGGYSNNAGTTATGPTANGAVGGGGAVNGGGTLPGGSVSGPGGTATGSTAAGGGAAVGGGASGPATVASGAGLQKLPGDRTHCVGGREFDPNLDYYAPVCVPGTPGGPYPNNGGATWRGVTNNTIELVNYVADYGAEVDQILKAQGTYYNADTAKQWNAPFSNFINTHYNLWGRKIHIDTVAGTCTTVPPDYACLQSEMDSIVAKYHPYGVFWETTLCSVCFAELSRLHVVNFGGGGFSDAFLHDNAPYSYLAGESASQVQTQFAKWYCAQMANKPAIFAGTQNPAQNFRNTKRQLGVFSTNDPDNKYTVQHVLYPALAKCGVSVNGHEYFYAQDINTATQQSQTAAAKMNTPQNPATTVLCLCDPVAPQFGQNAFDSDNYWPESLIADDQTMDFDSAGQTYSSSDGGDSLACPNSNPCEYDNAIGISSDDPQVAPKDSAAAKIWNMETGNKPYPSGVGLATLDIVWSEYEMFASLIQNTGPLLTPQRMRDAAPDLGARGGGNTGHPLKVFPRGGGAWTQDVRIVYWDKNKVSPYNGKHGTYVDMEGGRFNMNFATMSQPPAPEPENRH